MYTQTTLVTKLNTDGFLYLGWMKENIYQAKVTSAEALLVCINETFMQIKDSFTKYEKKKNLKLPEKVNRNLFCEISTILLNKFRLMT